MENLILFGTRFPAKRKKRVTNYWVKPQDNNFNLEPKHPPSRDLAPAPCRWKQPSVWCLPHVWNRLSLTFIFYFFIFYFSMFSLSFWILSLKEETHKFSHTKKDAFRLSLFFSFLKNTQIFKYLELSNFYGVLCSIINFLKS